MIAHTTLQQLQSGVYVPMIAHTTLQQLRDLVPLGIVFIRPIS